MAYSGRKSFRQNESCSEKALARFCLALSRFYRLFSLSTFKSNLSIQPAETLRLIEAGADFH